MSKSKRDFVMTFARLRQILGRKKVERLVCHHPDCRKVIRIGDKVHRHRSMGKVRYYHEECWRRALIG